LKTDVLLLSDILVNFQKKSLLNYKLDPLDGFFTLPHYAWNVMLYKIEIQLVQLTDPDMYLFCEHVKRGGISVNISHRYAEANNKYMKKYNPNEESSYICYYDANNLYGGAMSEKSPYADFRWSQLTKDECSGVKSPSKSPHRAVLVFIGNITKWPSLSPEEKQISSIQMLVISTTTR
jgi:hypothetical protein